MDTIFLLFWVRLDVIFKLVLMNIEHAACTFNDILQPMA